MLIELVSVSLMGLFDRSRGDNRNIVSKLFEKILYGLSLGLLYSQYIDMTPEVYVAVSAAMVIGSSPALGGAIEAAIFGSTTEPERWQKGALIDSGYLAMFVRGLMWGLPFFPLCYFDVSFIWAAVAFILAVPLSLRLTLLWKNWGTSAWKTMEWIRGIMAGLIVWGLL